MKSSATIQQRRTPWVRRALGVLVVMWLNLVLQPCAMAIGSDHQGDCPNCPPAYSQQHDVCGSAAKDMADHGRPCAAGSSADCGILDDFNYAGRNDQIKVKDAPHNLPGALRPTAESALGINPAHLTYLRPIQNHPPRRPRALNKLYCVYLK